MLKNRMGRRPLLKALAAGTAMAPIAGTSLAQAAGLRVRYNVYSERGGAMLASYAMGVAAMQRLPATDPRSWTYQAAIHGTYDQQTRTAWKTCQHGSWFFISWHRMYVYWFERIVRAQSGDPNFTLPYWNYTDFYPRHAIMPMQFRQPRSGNPLYVSQRNAAINDGQPLARSVVQDQQALDTIPFTGTSNTLLSFGGGSIPRPVHFSGYTGQLEQQPHNVVHNAIGGWMSDPNTAAQDPIFWAHHCNIDRLWNDWLSLGGNRKNPVTDATWMNTTFTFFDETGKQVNMTASQILDSAAQLGYVYDDTSSGGMAALALAGAGAGSGGAMMMMTADGSGASKAPGGPPVLAQSAQGIRLGSAPLSVTLRDADSTSGSVGNKAMGALSAPSPAAGTVLVVEGVKAETSPDVLYEVYLNLPEGASPDPTSIYFAGTLSFFGAVKAQMQGAHGGHSGGRTHTFDITRLVAAQMAKGVWSGDTPKVTFVPIDGTGAPANVADGAAPSVDKVYIAAE